MNGRKILLRGIHDKNYDPSLFKEITDCMVIHADGIAFTLMHDSMLSWPGSARGSIQRHGHIHALPDYNLKN